jgi:hypothetical protein
MPKTRTVVLTRAAREAGVPLDELHNAALIAAQRQVVEQFWSQVREAEALQFRAPAGQIPSPASFVSVTPTPKLLRTHRHGGHQQLNRTRQWQTWLAT